MIFTPNVPFVAEGECCEPGAFNSAPLIRKKFFFGVR